MSASNKLHSKLLALFLLCASNVAIADPTVAFDSRRTKVDVGDTFTITILMKGFPEIEGGGLSLRFNPNTLRVVNVHIQNNVWRFVNRNGDINNTRGTVTNILFSSFEGVEGDAPIASIDFEAIHKGMSTLELTGSTANPFASSGSVIPVIYDTARVHVRDRGTKK
jgi:hypothetical protein